MKGPMHSQVLKLRDETLLARRLGVVRHASPVWAGQLTVLAIVAIFATAIPSSIWFWFAQVLLFIGGLVIGVHTSYENYRPVVQRLERILSDIELANVE